MGMLGIAMLALGGQASPEIFQWQSALERSVAEVARRRRDLVPLAARESRLVGEERGAPLAFHSLWVQGRLVEAKAGLARAAERAGRGDEDLVAMHRDVLARDGVWARVRDSLAVDLHHGFLTKRPLPHVATILYALAVVESGRAAFGSRAMYRTFGYDAVMGDEEFERLYPATQDGMRRLIWNLYAGATLRHRTLTTHSQSKGPPEQRTLFALIAEGKVPDRTLAWTHWNSYQAQWAGPAAYRRFPDDPLAALSGWPWPRWGEKPVDETVERKAARLRAHFAPALRRLRPTDRLYREIQTQIAQASKPGG